MRVEIHLKILIVHSAAAIIGELCALVVFLSQLFATGVANICVLILPVVVAVSSCGITLTAYSLFSIVREYLKLSERYKKIVGIIYVAGSSMVTMLFCTYTAERIAILSAYIVVKPELQLNWFLGASAALLLVGTILTSYKLITEVRDILRGDLLAFLLSLVKSSDRKRTEESVVVIS